MHNAEYSPCPMCEFARAHLENTECDWCNGTGWALPPVSVGEELNNIELEDSIALDKAFQQQVGGAEPICCIDETDLIFNWETHTCNWCDGMGQEHYFTPDGDEGWVDCNNCLGTGFLATLKRQK